MEMKKYKKVVINKCFGGFSLSKAVYDELGIEWSGYGYIENEDLDIESNDSYAYRVDERLIKAIKKIGVKKASGIHAELKIVRIPIDVKYTIEEYDGLEHIAEVHRTWS